MLAPRVARWVEEGAGSGENAFNGSAALSPTLPPPPPYAGLRPACQHAGSSSCRLRRLRVSVLNPLSLRLPRFQHSLVRLPADTATSAP